MLAKQVVEGRCGVMRASRVNGRGLEHCGARGRHPVEPLRWGETAQRSCVISFAYAAVGFEETAEAG